MPSKDPQRTLKVALNLGSFGIQVIFRANEKLPPDTAAKEEKMWSAAARRATMLGPKVCPEVPGRNLDGGFANVWLAGSQVSAFSLKRLEFRVV